MGVEPTGNEVEIVGFGLFFVDSMVESYGDDVWVEDNDAGGATFVVELPLAKATASA